MKAYGWFKKELEEARDTFEYKLEGLELEVTETILRVMEEKGISRSDLAQKLGVSKAAVSKLLNNGSNMTLKRLLTIAEAMDLNLSVNFSASEQNVGQEVIEYNPRAQTNGFRFDLKDFDGADDYSISLEGRFYAVNGC
jgi:transcriptional regulator with XRE-family HTH domain